MIDGTAEIEYFAALMYDADDPEEAVTIYLQGDEPTGQVLKAEIESLLSRCKDPVELARAIGQYGDYGERAIAAMEKYPPDYHSYLEEALQFMAAANIKS